MEHVMPGRIFFHKKQMYSATNMFHNKHMMRFTSGVVLAAAMGNCLALGVSDIQLNSSLNQKLDANIQLNSASAEELSRLNITIMLNQAEGMPLQQLKHELVRTDSGGYLKITTDDVIKEPVLSFQLDLDWGNGQLVREYTLLLDPPGAR